MDSARSSAGSHDHMNDCTVSSVSSRQPAVRNTTTAAVLPHSLLLDQTEGMRPPLLQLLLLHYFMVWAVCDTPGCPAGFFYRKCTSKVDPMITTPTWHLILWPRKALQRCMPQWGHGKTSAPWLGRRPSASQQQPQTAAAAGSPQCGTGPEVARL